MISIINKSIIIKSSILLILGAATSLNATINSLPDQFKGQDENSTISIIYDDITTLYQATVLDMGMSDRKLAKKSAPEIGSRIKAKKKRHSALEGNRFNFQDYKKSTNKELVSNIRKSLEQVPDHAPMAVLNRKEQMAYWINLYNITLLEQLIEIFPDKYIEKELYGKDGIMKKKLLEVSGVKLSLDDIHYRILLNKFSDTPVVIYGLFQGVIGGPNIRTVAYNGKDIFKQLHQNAVEFVNSNRGTLKGKKDILKVSTYYKRNNQLFLDFNQDLKQHLGIYINEQYASHLNNSEQIRATLKDMTIADLTGSARRKIASGNTNPVALAHAMITSENPVNNNFQFEQNAMDSIQYIYTRFPAEDIKVLAQMKHKINKNRGKVEIESEK